MAKRTNEERNHGSGVSRGAKKGTQVTGGMDWEWAVWSADVAFKEAVNKTLADWEFGHIVERVLTLAKQQKLQLRLRYVDEDASWMMLLLRQADGEGYPTQAASIWHSDWERMWAGANVLLELWNDRGGWPMRAERGEW